MKTRSISSAALISILLLSGCSKEIGIDKTSVEDTSKFLNRKDNSSARQSYALDWENIEVMPTPPYIPEQVRAPWKSGANQQFNPVLQSDYRSSDGWELTYNTFNTTVNEDKLYFVLYNKYTGVLRMYLYIPNDSQYIASNNIVQSLEVVNSSSPMMNFSDQQIVNLSNNSPSASSIEPYKVGRGAWYVLEHELAYDETVSSKNFSSFQFKWTVTGTQLSQMQLDGTNKGEITGSIKQSGTNLTASPNININNNGQFTVRNGDDADKLLPALGSAIVSGIKDAISSGVGGLVEKVFSAVFGESDPNNVKLTVDTRISLTGTIQSSFAIQNPTLAAPGYAQDPSGGLTPAYNQSLGVFYLRNKPSVKVTVVQGSDRTTQTFTYRINQPIDYIFNPAVQGIASIQQVDADIVGVPNNNDGNEVINGSSYKVGPSIQNQGTGLQIKGVRLTLKVTPNNGSKPRYITKTFVATIDN